MKITKRQLRRIIREGLAAGQKSDFRTVYDALWSLYMGDMDTALDQEAKNRTVEEHGWTWDEYIQEATAQVEEMEKQMDLSMQSALKATKARDGY